MSNCESTLTSDVTGTVLSVVAEGTGVRVGDPVAVVESMKMEYVLTAPDELVVTKVFVVTGQAVVAGEAVVGVRVTVGDEHLVVPTPVNESVHPAVAELRRREQRLGDDARPERTEKRHAHGLRTARENLADLLDDGSYVEYGRFVYAAQSRRRAIEDLIDATPGDGLIGGLGTVNAALWGREKTACAVLSYDYGVLAGTQGQRGHQKKDRLFDVIDRLNLPVIFFTEGGGGRPGDTDNDIVTGLDTEAFHLFAALSGKVATIGIVAGRCFAGNAALLGSCNVIIACKGSSIGMGGPAMIEGGGLGVVEADDVGPAQMHAIVGSIDLLVEDEAQAVVSAKALLALTQGRRSEWTCDPVEALASVLPGDRRRSYDVRDVLGALFDHQSVIELRSEFGRSLVTAFARLEGRAVAVLANNPAHLAGAIDADAADKAAHFFQLANAWGLPVVSLVDTPGFMVGTDSEARGMVRHASRMFVAGAALSVPLLSVVTRRGYGLGAQAMCAGSFRVPLLTVAWPQAELGAMGLEGAVRLGFRRELEALEDLDARSAALEKMIDGAYERGRALNVAAHFELDDVIDPITTRTVLSQMLERAPERLADAPVARFVDTW